MSAILVSPLGKSPGAVSGVYFALQHEGVRVSQVITVGTQDEDVRTAGNEYLRKIFTAEGVEFIQTYVEDDDLYGEEAQARTMARGFRLALQHAQRTGLAVYVAVTGGRSGMGALAVMMAQMYGAKELLHLWVDPELEFNGTVEALRDSELVTGEEMVAEPVLNPTKWGTNAWQLVRLPFLNLQPLQPLLASGALADTLPDLDNPLLNLLVSSGAQRFTDLFPPEMTLGAVEKILALKGAFHQAETEAARVKALTQFVLVLKDAAVGTEAELEDLMTFVLSGAPPDGFLPPEDPGTPPSRVHMLGLWFQKYKGDALDGLKLMLGSLQTAKLIEGFLG